MKCLNCSAELIQGDTCSLDQNLYGDDYKPWNAVTILGCPDCKAFVEFFYQKKEKPPAVTQTA